jgi:hypothetical protein
LKASYEYLSLAWPSRKDAFSRALASEDDDSDLDAAPAGDDAEPKRSTLDDLDDDDLSLDPKPAAAAPKGRGQRRACAWKTFRVEIRFCVP